MLKQNKTNEALLTAERGRGQALMDLMERQYGLNLAQPGPGVQIGTAIAILNYISKQMGTMSDILRHISSPTVFLAVGTDAINFWVLKTGEKPIYVQKKIDEKYFREDAVHSLKSLNEDAYSKIGVLDGVRCDNRSLDEPTEERVADQSHGPDGGKGPTSPGCEDDVLTVLYDMVISPIADMIQGDAVTIVPDGPLFLAPFPAFKDQNSRYLAETFSIRLIPTLTSSKLMATERPEQQHGTSEALLVGDPWVGCPHQDKEASSAPICQSRGGNDWKHFEDGTSHWRGCNKKRRFKQTRLGCFSTHCRPWKSRNGRDCFMSKF